MIRRLAAPALLFSLAAIWGASFSVSKFAIEAGVAPFGYALWQVLGAATVVLIVSLLRRQRFDFTSRHFRFFAVTGLIGVAAPISSMYLAIGHIPAGLMAIIAASVPLFTYALARTLRIEPLSWQRLGGIAVGFAGVLLILVPRSGLSSQGMVSWVGVAFLVPFFYAVGATYTARRRPLETSAMPLTVGMLLFAALGLTPVVIATESFYAFQFPLGPIELAIGGQILIASLGYILFFELVRLAGPVYFSQAGYLVTVSGLFYAMWFLGERYSAWVWIGAGVLLLGVALVNRNPRANPKTAN